MQLLTTFIYINNFFNVYAIFEVDTDVYFCSPKNQIRIEWATYHPEFYITKKKGKWITLREDTGIPVSNDLALDAGKAIEIYLLENREEKKGS